MNTVSQTSRHLNSDDYSLEDIGIPITPTKTNEIDENDDPKIATGRRYKELSYVFNRLAERAAETEETYQIAVVGNNRILQDVEAKIKRMGVNQDRVTAAPADETDELEFSLVDGNMIADGLSDEPQIKGIKVKSKKNKAGSSRRFMSALEKATKKRSSKNKISTSRATKTTEKLSEVNQNNMNSPILQSDFGEVSASHYTQQVNTQGSNLLELNLNTPYFGSATEYNAKSNFKLSFVELLANANPGNAGVTTVVNSQNRQHILMKEGRENILQGHGRTQG
ncbi:hypothetical protein ACET3Z_024263 [Daucus carota]